MILKFLFYFFRTTFLLLWCLTCFFVIRDFFHLSLKENFIDFAIVSGFLFTIFKLELFKNYICDPNDKMFLVILWIIGVILWIIGVLYWLLSAFARELSYFGGTFGLGST